MSGRKIENLISGVDRSANTLEELDLSATIDRRSANTNTLEADLVSKIAQLDVSALLNAGAQGQGINQEQSQGQSQEQGQPQPQGQGLRSTGPSDINTSNVGADLANQVAAGNRPSVGTGDINTSNVGADLANQIAGFGTTAGTQNQTLGQSPAAAQAQPAPQAQAAAARPSGQVQGPAGPSDINTSNIAGDLANQLAPIPGVTGQRPASSDVAGDLANQLAGGAAANILGEVAAAQSSGAGAAVIEIRSTIIQEANGQQIATQIIQQVGQGQQSPAAPAATEAPAATAPQAGAPPPETKPTEVPAAIPISSGALSASTAAAEGAPQPVSQPTQPPAEGISTNVSEQ